MTGETERSPSGWTPDTLKVLEDEKISGLEARFSAELKRIEAVIAGQERAVTLLGQANQIAQDKFEATVRDGFVKQNEFRGSLDDLGKTMATRREMEASMASLGLRYDASHMTLVARVDDMSKQIVALGSRLDTAPDVRRLEAASERQYGLRQGAQITVGYFFSGIAALGSVVLIATYLATH